MTNKELYNWFTNKLNSCYIVKHTWNNNRIYYIYDESYVRKKKLCKLNNTIMTKSTFNGTCLFFIDTYYKILYCNYDEVWIFLEQNKQCFDIKQYLNRMIKKHDKLYEYDIYHANFDTIYKLLNEKEKITIL